MKAPQIVPFRPSFAWYSIGQRHGQVHSRSRLPCVTVAPNGYKEQLLRSTTLFIILVKCGNCIHRRVNHPCGPPGRNPGMAESLDYHITHSSLVKEPCFSTAIVPSSSPAKQISPSRWHAPGNNCQQAGAKDSRLSRGLFYSLTGISRRVTFLKGFLGRITV